MRLFMLRVIMCSNDTQARYGREQLVRRVRLQPFEPRRLEPVQPTCLRTQPAGQPGAAEGVGSLSLKESVCTPKEYPLSGIITRQNCRIILLNGLSRIVNLVEWPSK